MKTDKCITVPAILNDPEDEDKEIQCQLCYDPATEILLVTDKDGKQMSFEGGYTDFQGITQEDWEGILKESFCGGFCDIDILVFG